MEKLKMKNYEKPMIEMVEFDMVDIVTGSDPWNSDIETPPIWEV